MRPALLLLLAFASASGPGRAQPSCLPVLALWANHHAIPDSGAPFTSQVIVLVQPSTGCADAPPYAFREAELTLLRGKRPLGATRLVRQPAVDLASWAPLVRPGDRIYVVVRYQQLRIVAADGTRRPYLPPALRLEQARGLQANLLTEDAQGLHFTWLLR